MVLNEITYRNQLRRRMDSGELQNTLKRLCKVM